MRKLFLSLAALCGCVLTLSAIEYNAADLMKNVSTPLFQNRSAMNQETVKTALAYLDTVEAVSDAQKLNLIRYRVIAYDQTTGADRTLAGLKIRGCPDRKYEVRKGSDGCPVCQYFFALVAADRARICAGNV